MIAMQVRRFLDGSSRVMSRRFPNMIHVQSVSQCSGRGATNRETKKLAWLGLWVFEYDPSIKCKSVQWKWSDEPRHKKARMAQSQQKLMLILFFDVQGVVMVEWVPYWKNVDAAFYIEMLQQLKICIRKKRPELSVENLLVLHDNAPSHRADSTQKFLEKNDMW